MNLKEMRIEKALFTWTASSYLELGSACAEGSICLTPSPPLPMNYFDILIKFFKLQLLPFNGQ